MYHDGRCVHCKVYLLFPRRLFEGDRAFPQQIAQVKILHGQLQIRLIHPGQRQKILHQDIQSLRLGFDVARPLGFSGIEFKRLRVGHDDSERRFQLMPGIGHELLLPYNVLRNGGDRLFGKRDHEKEHQRPADPGDHKGDHDHGQNGRDL